MDSSRPISSAGVQNDDTMARVSTGLHSLINSSRDTFLFDSNSVISTTDVDPNGLITILPDDGNATIIRKRAHNQNKVAYLAAGHKLNAKIRHSGTRTRSLVRSKSQLQANNDSDNQNIEPAENIVKEYSQNLNETTKESANTSSAHMLSLSNESGVAESKQEKLLSALATLEKDAAVLLSPSGKSPRLQKLIGSFENESQVDSFCVDNSQTQQPEASNGIAEIKQISPIDKSEKASTSAVAPTKLKPLKQAPLGTESATKTGGIFSAAANIFRPRKATQSDILEKSNKRITDVLLQKPPPAPVKQDQNLAKIELSNNSQKLHALKRIEAEQERTAHSGQGYNAKRSNTEKLLQNSERYYKSSQNSSNLVKVSSIPVLSSKQNLAVVTNPKQPGVILAKLADQTGYLHHLIAKETAPSHTAKGSAKRSAAEPAPNGDIASKTEALVKVKFHYQKKLEVELKANNELRLQIRQLTSELKQLQSQLSSQKREYTYAESTLSELYDLRSHCKELELENLKLKQMNNKLKAKYSAVGSSTEIVYPAEESNEQSTEFVEISSSEPSAPPQQSETARMFAAQKMGGPISFQQLRTGIPIPFVQSKFQAPNLPQPSDSHMSKRTVLPKL